MAVREGWSAKTSHFLIPNSSFLLFFVSAIFRALMQSPEKRVREKIDKLPTECGSVVQNYKQLNLSAGFRPRDLIHQY